MKRNDIQDMYRHDLSSYFKFAFRELHPGVEYQHNWHVDVMAYHLAKVEKGTTKRLIITMPPRMLKSECVSIAWPTWMLGRDPCKKVLCLHNSLLLGKELHEASLHIINSPRYRGLFPHMQMTEQKRKAITPLKGHRQYLPIGGKLTGLGADIIIIDDPMSTEETHNKEDRERIKRQFDENISQRLNNRKNSAIVLVMQRLHEDDLVSHLLGKNEGWVHVDLPAIALKTERWDLPHGKAHLRPKGEVLHKGRETKEQLIETLGAIGGYAFAYQYLQGQYKPRFGDAGHGGIWLTPMREGEFYNKETAPIRRHGFYTIHEQDLILSNVFDIGESPYPQDMRTRYTMDEMRLAAEQLKEALKYKPKHVEDFNRNEDGLIF